MKRCIWAPESTVCLGEGLTGVVLEICIKSSGNQYRVVWWDGNNRKSEWLEECELTAHESNQKITMVLKGD